MQHLPVFTIWERVYQGLLLNANCLITWYKSQYPERREKLTQKCIELWGKKEHKPQISQSSRVGKPVVGQAQSTDEQQGKEKKQAGFQNLKGSSFLLGHGNKPSVRAQQGYESKEQKVQVQQPLRLELEEPETKSLQVPCVSFRDL